MDHEVGLIVSNSFSKYKTASTFSDLNLGIWFGLVLG